jgi:hypothetical protein
VPSEFRANLVVRTRTAWLQVAVLALVAVGLLGSLSARLAGTGLLHSVSSTLIVTGALLLGAEQVRRRRRAGRKEIVAVTEAGIQTARGLVPRRRLVDGVFQPGECPLVRVYDRYRFPTFEAEVVDEAEATRLLAALGLDAASRRAAFRVFSARPFDQALRAITLVLLILGAPIAAAFHVAPALVFAFVLPLFVATFLATRLVVGVDGVHLRTLGGSRFIPLSDIEAIEPDGNNGIRIRCRSGKDELVRSTNKRESTARVASEQRDAILARLLEVWRAHDPTKPPPDVVQLLARGGRSLSSWRTALDGLRGETDYRRAPVREEDLWRVVEDAGAPADARAGAAAVLRHSLDEAGRSRVRVAAAATASPKLRVALDAAAGGDDGALDAAFDSLDERSSLVTSATSIDEPGVRR